VLKEISGHGKIKDGIVLSILKEYKKNGELLNLLFLLFALYYMYFNIILIFKIIHKI